ncbi:MAG: DUF3131 domain-containing protein [Candidatus Omnitrophica bacterium]|nr:DUF3131 domain-containing protein [Candidatus Omnitrophota bacterium]
MFFLNTVGCGAQDGGALFHAVPPGKTPSSTYKFYLIDDFNAGFGKTKLGTEWKTSQTNGSALKLFSEREDGVKFGGSLAVEYDLAAQENAAVFTPLNGMDASQAQFLVFLLRRKDLETFPGKIAIGLVDSTGRSITIRINRNLKKSWKGPNSDWAEVAIPKNSFRGLDFNQLERFEITLTSQAKPIRGKLVIDEIGFFGPDELVFRSDQDNLIGFPSKRVAQAKRDALLRAQEDQEFLRQIARDSWLYFENLVDRQTHLVVDHVRVGETPGVGSYISPTNLALYWIANVAAFDLSLISKEKAVRNIELSFESFEKLHHWGSGFYYNYYHTRSFRVTRKYVSVVDNGWLAAGLVILRQAFPEHFGKKATELLKALHFAEFYDPLNGQLKLGFDTEKDVFSPYHYGLLVTEARIASYIAIGKGDLGKEHWAKIYRTLPVEWTWQKQIPKGKDVTLFGEPVFEGYYTYLDKKFVPSWGGSLFEFLSPTLLVAEQELAPKSLGKNNTVATDLHIAHARGRKYAVWGMSPCATRNGRHWTYREYGIPEMGTKGYPDRGVVTPYAAFLALATRPEAAIQNLRTMLSKYPEIYGEYGFYDSVDASKGLVNPQYLVLDQGMSFLAIANYLKQGGIRKRFHSDPIGKAVEALLKEEVFDI